MVIFENPFATDQIMRGVYKAQLYVDHFCISDEKLLHFYISSVK